MGGDGYYSDDDSDLPNSSSTNTPFPAKKPALQASSSCPDKRPIKERMEEFKYAMSLPSSIAAYYFPSESANLTKTRGSGLMSLERQQDFEKKSSKSNIVSELERLRQLPDEKLFSAETFKQIHYNLFDVSDPTIAGHFRKHVEQMQRGGISFKSTEIPDNLQIIFDHMKKNLKSDDQAFIRKFSVYDMLVYLTHSFINGNTRSKDTFMSEVARRFEHNLEINFTASKDKKEDHLRITTSTFLNLTLLVGTPKKYNMSEILNLMDTTDGWKKLENATADYYNYLTKNNLICFTKKESLSELAFEFDDMPEQQCSSPKETINIESLDIVFAPLHTPEQTGRPRSSTTENLDLAVAFRRPFSPVVFSHGRSFS